MAVSVQVQRIFAELLVNLSESQDQDLTAEDRENFARNAVRSAYYACFHAALHWAERRGYEKPDTWGSHEGLWDCWYKQEPQTRNIRQRANALKAKRVEADYRVGEAFTINARDVLQEADEFVALIVKDQERVTAMRPPGLRVVWDKTAHPKPRRRGGNRR